MKIYYRTALVRFDKHRKCLLEEITVNQIKASSIFRISLTGFLIGTMPIFILLGILSATNVLNPSLLGLPELGMKILYLAPLAGSMCALVLAIINGVILNLGLKIYALFMPISFKVQTIPSRPNS